VFKTTDGGGHWNGASTGLPPPAVTALAIDPATPTTLFAGTALGGVFKSTDSGGHWSAASVGLPPSGDGTSVEALDIDPTTPSTLYTGTRSGGVFKSTDGGAHWNAASTGLSSHVVKALAIDPAAPTTLYAGNAGRLGCFGGVFKSTDSGGHWTTASAGLPLAGVRALAVNPATPTTVYAGTLGGVFMSTDGGDSWNAASTGLPACTGLLADSCVFALAIDPTTTSTLYAGTFGAGVFKSSDGGGHWSAANAGLTGPAQLVQALAIDPSTSTTLYAGTSGAGVLKSTDGGGHWSAVNAGLTGKLVQALAIDPNTPTTVYAGTSGGVFDLEQPSCPPGGLSEVLRELNNVSPGMLCSPEPIDPVLQAFIASKLTKARNLIQTAQQKALTNGKPKALNRLEKAANRQLAAIVRKAAQAAKNTGKERSKISAACQQAIDQRMNCLRQTIQSLKVRKRGTRVAAGPPKAREAYRARLADIDADLPTEDFRTLR